MDLGSELKPKAWHGLLKTVAVSPAPIYVREDCGQADIYFRPKDFKIDVRAVIKVLDELILNDNCSGFDPSRLNNGHIRIYFNPACHGASDSHRAIHEVVEVLCKSEPKG
jgi:hypothetical protein